MTKTEADREGDDKSVDALFVELYTKTKIDREGDDNQYPTV